MKRKKLEITLNQALQLHQSGQHDEAERLYAQVRRSAPRLFDGWFLSGALAFQRGGHLEQAVQLLTRALQLQPAASQCRLFLGMALADSGRHAEAVSHLRSALPKHPGYAEAWENLVVCLLALERRAEACECVQRALELHPDHAGLLAQHDALQPTSVGAGAV